MAGTKEKHSFVDFITYAFILYLSYYLGYAALGQINYEWFVILFYVAIAYPILKQIGKLPNNKDDAELYHKIYRFAVLVLILNLLFLFVSSFSGGGGCFGMPSVPSKMLVIQLIGMAANGSGCASAGLNAAQGAGVLSAYGIHVNFIDLSIFHTIFITIELFDFVAIIAILNHQIKNGLVGDIKMHKSLVKNFTPLAMGVVSVFFIIYYPLTIQTYYITPVPCTQYPNVFIPFLCENLTMNNYGQISFNLQTGQGFWTQQGYSNIQLACTTASNASTIGNTTFKNISTLGNLTAWYSPQQFVNLQCYGSNGVPFNNGGTGQPSGTRFTGYIWLNYTATSDVPSSNTPLIIESINITVT